MRESKAVVVAATTVRDGDAEVRLATVAEHGVAVAEAGLALPRSASRVRAVPADIDTRKATRALRGCLADVAAGQGAETT